MYLGERPWPNGVVAGTACDEYFAMARVPLSETTRGLLRRCLAANRDERPHDFAEVEAELLRTYEETSGEAYPRESPKAAGDTADSLNNRALSFIDLGKPEEAEKCWEKALEADPNHEESLFNDAVHRWNSAKTSDAEVLEMISNLKIKKKDYYLAKIHLMRGDAYSALEYIRKVKERKNGIADIEHTLSLAQKMIREETGIHCLREIVLNSHSGAVRLMPDSKRVLTYGENEDHRKHKYKLCFWDMDSGECVKTFYLYAENGKELCVRRFLSSANGKTILVYCKEEGGNNEFFWFDTETGSLRRAFEGDTAEIDFAWFCNGEDKLLTVNAGGMVKIWHLSSSGFLFLIIILVSSLHSCF
jgi:tetratricopeptide (TPR) repeat protein